MADTTAVSRAAERPPTSAITMVKARKAKARLDAGVSVRSGTSTTPRISAPRPPTAIQIRLSFRAPMPLLLLVALLLLVTLLHEVMPVEAHPPLLAETARRRAAAPARNGGFESQRLAHLRDPLISLCWLPAHDALSFSRSNLHASPLFVRGGARSHLVTRPASRSRQAGARTRQEIVKTGTEPRMCLTLRGVPWLSASCWQDHPR